jgi:hypothetical protein
MDWSFSGRFDRFEYTRVDSKTLENVEVLDVVADGGSIEYNDLTALKVSATVPLLGRLDLGEDWLRIYSIHVLDDEEVRLAHATLMLSVPSYTLTSKRSFEGPLVQGTAELYSLLHILEEQVTDVPLSIPAGTLAVQYAASLISSAGLSVQSDESAAVLNSGATFDAGTPYLEIVNWLLDYAGFDSAEIDGYGNVQLRRYTDPSALSPVVIFRDDDECTFFEGVVQQFNMHDVPNKVIVIMTNEETTLTSVAVNDDPQSRYSTVSRGRAITRVETVTQAESQAALDAVAESVLRTATSAVESVVVSHVFVPFETGQAGRLIYAQAEMDFVGVAASKTLTLSHGMPCETRFRRFVRM